MAVVDCGVDQALVALRSGHAKRIERAELLRHVRARGLDPGWLLVDPPECIATMFTFDFLRHIPGVGATRIREINRVAMRNQMNLAVSLGELTPSRRRWLAQMLARVPQPRNCPQATGRWPLVNRPQG